MITVMIAGCGGPSGGDASSGDSSSSTARDLSGIGAIPNFPTDHASYLGGDHESFDCASCHTLPLDHGYLRTEPDLRYVSPSSVRRLKHTDHKIGTYCNSCHYSDSFTTKNRVAHDQYHDQIVKGRYSCHRPQAPDWHVGAGLTPTCEDCHAYPSFKPAVANNHSRITGNCVSCHFGTQPSSHSGVRLSGCVKCHSYPAWGNTTAYDHNGVTSVCDASGRHTKAYSGYDCICRHVKPIRGTCGTGGTTAGSTAALVPLATPMAKGI